MARLDEQFDAMTSEPQPAFDLLPSGKYTVQIIDSDLRHTKNGDGKYLWIEMEVIEGEYIGRRIWDRLNIENRNPLTQDIARRNLAAICQSVGETRIFDSEQLHRKPLLVTVRIKPARDGYDACNQVRGYEKAERRKTQLDARRPSRSWVG